MSGFTTAPVSSIVLLLWVSFTAGYAVNWHDDTARLGPNLLPVTVAVS